MPGYHVVVTAAHAGGITIRHVALGGSDTSDYANPSFPWATIQFALDQANAGNEIRTLTSTAPRWTPRDRAA